MRSALAAVLLAACGSSGGSSVDASVAPRCDPAAPFGEPAPVDGLNTELDDASARLSSDERVVTFSRSTTSGVYDLYSATREDPDGPFGMPELLTTVNSVNSDLWPTLSPSGLLLAFETDRAATELHIYVSTRASTSDRFDTPALAVTLFDREGQPMIATDRALYFASDARTGQGLHDIWRTEIDTTGAMAPPTPVPGAINTADDEAAPAVTLDERTMFYRHTVGSEVDIYSASRATPLDGFGAPSPVDGLSKLGIEETPTWVSPDGCHLYFHSNAGGNDDIFVAKRP